MASRRDAGNALLVLLILAVLFGPEPLAARALSERVSEGLIGNG